VAATIVHPWNVELVDRGRQSADADWHELRENLEPCSRSLPQCGVPDPPARACACRTRRCPTCPGASLPARRTDDLPPTCRRRAERQVNDWGRSERVEGILDRTLVDFFYNTGSGRVEGSETARRGGALLVSNTPARCRGCADDRQGDQGGAHHPRLLNITVEHSSRLPVLDADPKSGGRGHPGTSAAAVRRAGARAVFPEDGRAPRSSTRTATASGASAARFVEAAMRARFRSSPSAWSRRGAAPIFAHLNFIALSGSRTSDHATFPHFACRMLGTAGQVQDRFLSRSLRDEGCTRQVARPDVPRVRARIQENVWTWSSPGSRSGSGNQRAMPPRV